MFSVEELKKYHGRELTREFVDIILSNFRLTRHSIEEMRNRTSFVDLVVDKDEFYSDGTQKIDFKATMDNIKKAIDKYTLAYINTDGSINIALSDYDYFVFAYDELKRIWSLVTFKEKSWYDKTIQDKRQLAIDGIDRNTDDK